MSNYKLVLVGDDGVGKTSLIKRLITGKAPKGYIPTLCMEVKPLVFNTNYGTVTFYIWDISGKNKFSGLGVETYAIGADAIMGICDLTSEMSANNLDWWYNKINNTNIPSVICGNKFDINFSKHKVSKLKKMSLVNKWGMYYDISVKTNYDFEKPFLYLARKLTGHNDLVFVPSPQ